MRLSESVCPTLWVRRFVSAVLFVAACGFCLYLSGACDESGDSIPLVRASVSTGLPSVAGSPSEDVPSDAIEGASEVPFAFFSMLDGFSDYRIGFLPEGFEEEVVSADELGCSCVYSAQGVVGFVCEGNSGEVRDRIASLMESGGWFIADDGGESEGMTLTRASGSYRWVYVLCSEVSGSVSVWMVYSTEGSQ